MVWQRESRPAVRTALLAFIVVRVATLIAFGIAAVLTAQDSHRHLTGLLGWDAAWYRDISEVGYKHLPEQALRFFPLLPLLVRFLATPLHGSNGVVLLLVCNACAFLVLVVVQKLVLELGFDAAVGRRTAWVLALAPSGYTSVMGYTEPVYLLLLTLGLLALCRGQWLTYAGVALCAGALRPTGILLAVPVAVVAAQQLARHARVPARTLLAVLAAPVGTASYLLWCRAAVGDGLAPFHVQSRKDLRGGFLVNPFPAVGEAFRSFGTQGAGLHVFWAALSLVLLGLCFRRLPLALSSFAAVSLLLALTARDLSSFERYGGSTLPLLIVVAGALPRSRVRLLSISAISIGVMISYASITFLREFTP